MGQNNVVTGSTHELVNQEENNTTNNVNNSTRDLKSNQLYIDQENFNNELLYSEPNINGKFVFFFFKFLLSKVIYVLFGVSLNFLHVILLFFSVQRSC